MVDGRDKTGKVRSRKRATERLRQFGGMLFAASIAAGGAWILNELRHLPQSCASPVRIIPSTRPASISIVAATSMTSPAEVFARCSPAVVRVFAFDIKGQRGQGSGFVLSADGLVVTNRHVIDGKCTYQIALGDDRLISVDRVVAVDRAADLALLKVDAKDLPMLKLSPGAMPAIGTRVYAIGSPRDLSNTLSEGLVSGLRHETPGVTHIQTTAPISPGSSGGPLLDDVGRVIGVTSAFRADGQNLNFAIETGRVNELLDLGRFYLEAARSPGSPRWWLAHAMRNASQADETRPAVFVSIGQAAIDAGDMLSAAWAARFAERAGLCGGDTAIWQIPVARLYRKANESDRASRLLESAGISESDIPAIPARDDRPLESDRRLVLACAERVAANQIDAACDIASGISSWRERAHAVRVIARALTTRATPERVLSWIEQQGDGWEGSQMRAMGCLGPVDARR